MADISPKQIQNKNFKSLIFNFYNYSVKRDTISLHLKKSFLSVSIFHRNFDGDISSSVSDEVRGSPCRQRTSRFRNCQVNCL
jgi:hypothetical protein